MIYVYNFTIFLSIYNVQNISSNSIDLNLWAPIGLPGYARQYNHCDYNKNQFQVHDYKLWLLIIVISVNQGNWYNELILQEEKSKQYMRRTKNAELKVQKTRKLFLSLLKEIPLTFPVIGLSYGAIIQILSPDMPTKYINKIKEKQGIVLGVDIDYKNIDERCTLAHGDRVIGTGLMTPCVRNVWTLVPEDSSCKGKKLKFGEAFHIQLCSSNPPLYVQCLTPSPTIPTGESGHVVPTLSNYTNCMTRFKAVHVDSRLRFETEGSVIQPFEKVAIIKAANSECLAVEPDTWFPTFFGMECEVSVHTFKDRAKPYKLDPRNYWCFVLSSA